MSIGILAHRLNTLHHLIRHQGITQSLVFRGISRDDFRYVFIVLLRHRVMIRGNSICEMQVLGAHPGLDVLCGLQELQR